MEKYGRAEQATDDNIIRRMRLIEVFHRLNAICCNMDSTQPLTEMSTRDISWGVRWPVLRDDYITTSMYGIFRNPGSLSLLESSGPL